jgi:hypothetical protein
VSGGPEPDDDDLQYVAEQRASGLACLVIALVVLLAVLAVGVAVYLLVGGIVDDLTRNSQ